MDATGIYFLARLCTCAVWTVGGIYEIFHYDHTAVKMAQHHIPWSRYVLVLVIIMKLGGSLMLITNQLVWAAALFWIIFIIPATLLYHSSFHDANGSFIHAQLTQFSKNISILGGLLSLILLDPDKPQWLIVLLHRM